MKLKVFADKAYLPDNDRYVVLLYPFWGALPDAVDDVDKGRFDEYGRIGRDFIVLSDSIEESDIVILPFEWRTREQWGDSYYIHLKTAAMLSEEAKKHGKHLLVFFNNDSDESVPLDNAIVFRTSFYRSSRKKNEFAIPGWSVDFMQRYMNGELKIRKKGTVPVVGYCGYLDYVDPGVRNIIYRTRLLFEGGVKSGVALRGAAVRTLLKDRRVKMNFINRKSFMGGCDQAAREEYVNNMVNSDYALAARGAGNFSYRFYEVLSCGRIPVFVDSDCVLPFDHLIDWRKYAVWVDSRDIGSIGDRVIEFHRNISDADFEELQRSARRVYEEWISPAAFHRNLWRCIK